MVTELPEFTSFEFQLLNFANFITLKTAIRSSCRIDNFSSIYAVEKWKVAVRFLMNFQTSDKTAL